MVKKVVKVVIGYTEFVFENAGDAEKFADIAANTMSADDRSKIYVKITYETETEE